MSSLGQFVRGLYFDVQTVEGVQPLEIWNGVRTQQEPFEAASLVKNLLKITVPLVNEVCAGRPFSAHARRTRQTLARLVGWFRDDPEGRLLERFPDPPTGDAGQKELYRTVREAATLQLARIESAPPEPRFPEVAEPKTDPEAAMLPDGLFDFREMRIVDNELPFIIFTEKEYRVIHGLAIVYMWIIGSDEIFLDSLPTDGTSRRISEEYREFARRVQAENPLLVKGRETDPRAILSRIREKLEEEDYLDIFHDVHRWFEQTRARFLG
jgi:hypothetical protein